MGRRVIRQRDDLARGPKVLRFRGDHKSGALANRIVPVVGGRLAIVEAVAEVVGEGGVVHAVGEANLVEVERAAFGKGAGGTLADEGFRQRLLMSVQSLQGTHR